jgi:DnaJ-class molecular chaperone
MCKKERTYDKVRIEVCRNCHGAGLIHADADGNPKLSKCPICGGSGRVKKTVNIDITIEPYTGDLHAMK